nr:MAG TPA: hypothetical protein [Bacteriophage sp.]
MAEIEFDLSQNILLKNRDMEHIGKPTHTPVQQQHDDVWDYSTELERNQCFLTHS